MQRERFFNEEDYVRMKDFYILDKAKMALAREDMLVLHPLPRVNEISRSRCRPKSSLFQTGTVRCLCKNGIDFKLVRISRLMLNVGRLSEGVVLDHIKAGKSMTIYHDLKLDKLDCCVAIIKMPEVINGTKDIIKVECPIDSLNLDILGFIDHNITVKY